MKPRSYFNYLTNEFDISFEMLIEICKIEEHPIDFYSISFEINIKDINYLVADLFKSYTFISLNNYQLFLLP